MVKENLKIKNKKSKLWKKFDNKNSLILHFDFCILTLEFGCQG